MARGINKLILIGDPGQDPEVRFMPSGNPVANIRIATTDTWVDRQSGRPAPGAHREAQPGALQPAGRKLAEIAQPYLLKKDAWN